MLKLWESLEGWCTLEKAQRLYDLVKETDAQHIAELGVFGGKSLLPMAQACKDKGSGVCVGVDAWKKEPALTGTNAPENDAYWANMDYEHIFKSCSNAIVKFDLSKHCELFRLTTFQAAQIMSENVYDIIHQDSAHNPETIIQELDSWLPKLKQGGYWVIDDCDWPETIEGYNKLPSYGLELVEDFVKWQIWKKK